VIRPRRLAHRGSVEAWGWLDPCARRAPALAAWRPAVDLRQTPEGLAVLFPEPRRLPADAFPGAPLVKLGEALCAAPLDPDELAALGAEPGSLVTTAAGYARVCGRGDPVDPAAWLDLSGWTCAATATLGLPPAPPTPRVPPARLAREIFAETVAPDPVDAAALARDLREGGNRPSPPLARLARGLRGLIAALSQPSAVVGAPHPSPGGGPGAGGGALALPPRPGLLQRLDGWLADWLVRAGMGGVVGAAHSRQLQELLDRFQRGDLGEAVRRALPLGGEGGLEGALRAAGLFEAPRSDLSFRSQGPSSVVLVDPSVMATLRQAYRQAYRRLLAEGRIDEAAYLLAELLGEVDEALLMLEERERWALAAELAEAKKVAAGLRVRLWFLAGQIDRAIAIARREDAFADAIGRLERADPERARLFRVAWAASLARQGAWAAAAQALMDARIHAPVVQTWLLRAVEGGGVTGMGALARIAESFPACWPKIAPRVADLLADDQPGADLRRLHLATALATIKPTDTTRPLMRAATRAVLRDAALLGRVRPRLSLAHDLARLLHGTLRADLPNLAGTGGLHERAVGSLRLVLPAADRGMTPIRDARWLPNGQVLLALGQAGLELRSARGARLVHWDHPADHLVLSDDGVQAIALDRRGAWARLTRVDLASRRAVRWCDAELDLFAPTFSGTWFVTGPRGLLGVDAADDGWSFLWHMDPEAPIRALARDPGHLSLLVGTGADLSVWTYALPQVVLRDREDLKLAPFGPEVGGAPMGLGPAGGFDLWIGGRAHCRRPRVRELSEGLQHPLATRRLRPLTGEAWYGLLAEGRIVLVPRTGSQRLEVHFESSRDLCAHLDPETLTLFDATGRLLVVRLECLSVDLDLRL